MRVKHHVFHHIFSSRGLAIAVLAVLVLVGSVFVRNAFAASESASDGGKLVTIHDGSFEVTIVSRAANVKGALDQAGIALGDQDIVEPALDEQLIAKSYQVNIFRARPVVVVDGTSSWRIMTAEQSPKQIARVAGLTLHDEDVTTLQRVDDVLSAGGAGLKLVIKRATVFSFTLYGKTFEARTQAATVGGLIKEKSITLGPNDGVSPDLSTPLTSGLNVKIWRDGKQTITEEVAITKPVEEIKDTSRDYGTRLVKTSGVDGKRNVTYEIEMRDGVEISRLEIASVTVLEPVKETIIVGAKALGSYTTPSENETITWNFLIAQGFTREQTAGIMGNLMQEHRFNTTGDGLAQWTGGRKANLLARHDPYNINTQLQFMMDELNGPYIRVLNALRAATTVEQATLIFQNQYERCGVCMESRRIQYAYNILASH